MTGAGDFDETLTVVEVDDVALISCVAKSP